MMDKSTKSVFQEYYENPAFVDRYADDPNHAVDVIVPVIHTNELWRANLLSFYREIPVHNLLIGDGGCIDDSIEIAREFPRVKVLDHRSYESLGYSIRGLIETVETDWFIYIHSDAYLPFGWFDAMQKHQGEYDWFGCPMQHTVMVEYNLDYGERPWAGSQMGRKKAFDAGLGRIDDDYVYRQEDFVFADIVRNAGFKEGKVTDTFHYHQTMHKPSPWFRQVTSVKIDVSMTPEEELRTWTMQLRGTIKYLEPSTPWAVRELGNGMLRLLALNQMNWRELRKWAAETNPQWLPYISIWQLIKIFAAIILRRMEPYFPRLRKKNESKAQ